jgi:hypothetical protein
MLSRGSCFESYSTGGPATLVERQDPTFLRVGAGRVRYATTDPILSDGTASVGTKAPEWQPCLVNSRLFFGSPVWLYRKVLFGGASQKTDSVNEDCKITRKKDGFRLTNSARLNN